MYLQKSISKKTLKRNLFFVICQPLMKKAGSGSVNQWWLIRGSGSVPKWHFHNTASQHLQPMSRIGWNNWNHYLLSLYLSLFLFFLSICLSLQYNLSLPSICPFTPQPFLNLFVFPYLSHIYFIYLCPCLPSVLICYSPSVCLRSSCLPSFLICLSSVSIRLGPVNIQRQFLCRIYCLS